MLSAVAPLTCDLSTALVTLWSTSGEVCRTCGGADTTGGTGSGSVADIGALALLELWWLVMCVFCFVFGSAIGLAIGWLGIAILLAT